MFSNLEHHENLDFINKWKDGYNDLIDAVTNQEDITLLVNFTTNFDHGKIDEIDQESYDTMVSKICTKFAKTSNSQVLRNYGVNCTQFNQNLPNPCVGQGNSNTPQCGKYLSKVSNECAGKIGYSFGKAGFGNFGINCNSK